MKKKEKIILVSVLILSLSIWGVTEWLYHSRDYGSIQIMIGNDVYGTYSLSKDQIISINGTNTLEIKDKTAMMIDADCPDHICMQLGPITENGGIITCMPNRIVVSGIPSQHAVENDLVIDAVG